MKWSSRKLIRRIYWIAKYRGCHMEKRVAILLAMCYVAAAWGATEIDTSLLERGNRLLARGESRLGCTGNLSWDRSRLLAARARMLGCAVMATVLLLLDAFRRDYLSDVNTPFLWRCSCEGEYYEGVEQSFGFCERSEILSGLRRIIRIFHSNRLRSHQ